MDAGEDGEHTTYYEIIELYSTVLQALSLGSHFFLELGLPVEHVMIPRSAMSEFVAWFPLVQPTGHPLFPTLSLAGWTALRASQLPLFSEVLTRPEPQTIG